MHPKRAISLTLVLSISLWALTALLPDRQVLAATHKPGPSIEQAGDSSRGNVGSSSRMTPGSTNLTGDPDQTTQSGDNHPAPGSGTPPSGRSLVETLFRTIGYWFASIRGISVR